MQLAPSALAAFTLLLACLAVSEANARQRKCGLLEQLLANASRSQGVEVSTSDPDAIAATPFFQELPSQQRGQLLLQAARVHLIDDGSASPNVSTATQLLHSSADGFGNPDAQFFLGALATFEDDASDSPAAQSVLYHHFAARSGSIAASMALGYRHLYGYDVPKSCESSLRYYKFAADRVISLQSSERPIQVFSSPKPFRLTDDASKKKPGRTDEDAHRMEYLRQKALGSSDPVLLEKAASVVLFSDLPHGTVTIATSSSIDPFSHDHAPEHTRSMEAKTLLDRAASLGSFSAKALLGHVYAYGLGGFHPNVPKAIRLYEGGSAERVGDREPDQRGGCQWTRTHLLQRRGGHAHRLRARDAALPGLSAHWPRRRVYNTGVLLSESHPQRAQELVRLKIKAQILLMSFRERLWSVQNQLCELMGLPSLRYHEQRDGDGDEDTYGGKSSNAPSEDAGHSHQVGLVQSQVQGSLAGVHFASAMRFTEESKLQLGVQQSQQQSRSFTLEFWVRIQTHDLGDSKRTHMVLLDMQDSHQLELVRSDNKNEWVVQFRTMSTLFVFPKAQLSDAKWSHIALVVGAAQGDASGDSTPTISLFVNGELRQQFEYQSHLDEPSDSTQKILSIGSSLTRSASSAQTSSQFTGSLMNFRTRRSAKTEASVRTLMLTPQHQLSQRDVVVQLQFQIRRDYKAQTTLERSTSSVDATTPIYAVFNIDPEIVQFPPEEVKSNTDS